MVEAQQVPCPICEEVKPATAVTLGLFLPNSLIQIIRRKRPRWTPQQPICHECIRENKANVVQEMLEEEMGELSPLEEDVVESIRTDTFVTTNEFVEDEHPSLGQQLAHRITSMIGNWYFPLTIALLLTAWILFNISIRPFSPYPMIVLGVISAILASLAALQGPIIIMSQRAQQKRDRLRAETEYRVNLKAELEIRYLDDKVEKMMKMQHQILGELQRQSGHIRDKRSE